MRSRPHSHYTKYIKPVASQSPLAPGSPYLAIDEVQATLAEVLLVRLRLSCVVEGTQAGHQVRGVLWGHSSSVCMQGAAAGRVCVMQYNNTEGLVILASACGML
jgi:hypothetical protein